MHNNDIIRRIIVNIDSLILKKGADINSRKNLMSNINMLTGDAKLQHIWINEVDSITVPDVFVMPRYNAEFNKYALNADESYLIPWGYTLEISKTAFIKYTAEELTALVIHAISQNIMSTVSRNRFIRAYNDILNEYPDSVMVDVFDDLSHSEVCFIAYCDICMRPLMTDLNSGLVGSDEIVTSLGLKDAYDSARLKLIGVSKDTSDDIITKEMNKDIGTMKSIFLAVVNSDMKHYFEMVRKAVPLVTIQSIMTNTYNGKLTFTSDNTQNPNKIKTTVDSTPQIAFNESLSNPQNEEELRFQIDKIAVAIDHLATEDEKTSILYRIKVLRIRILKTQAEVRKKIKSNKLSKREGEYKLQYLDQFLEMLEQYRKEVLVKKIKPRTFGMWLVYPPGYEG